MGKNKYDETQIIYNKIIIIAEKMIFSFACFKINVTDKSSFSKTEPFP